MSLLDVAMLGACLADGLARIHEAGLVHRDLKPRNILLGPDGPKMIDFGLAMLTDGENHLDESGLLVGTIAYMAPEQGFSDGEVSTATDIYALGATLVFAFSCHHPYPTERGSRCSTASPTRTTRWICRPCRTRWCSSSGRCCPTSRPTGRRWVR
ncbi:serine/threonine protein kinase [Luedemannella flava]